MSTFTLKQITKALHISRSRVEQWISRGFFRTPDRPIFGAARVWDIGGIMRLALCAELVDAQLSPEHAGILTQVGLIGFKDDTAFFVAWRGTLNVPGIKRGDGKAVTGHLPGWSRKIIRGRDLRTFLENPDVHSAHVFNLDNLESRVKAAMGIVDE